MEHTGDWPKFQRAKVSFSMRPLIVSGAGRPASVGAGVIKQGMSFFFLMISSGNRSPSVMYCEITSGLVVVTICPAHGV
jgi:hypothetical protein